VLAAGLVLVALALLLAVRLLSSGPDVQAVPQDRPGPVLLVPGYGGNTSELQGLADALTRAGREVEIVPVGAGGTGDLRAEARRLQAAAGARLAAGAPSVDVVGYSAGGVVARLWVQELGGGSLARRVVTLGAPHHGTRVAAIGAAFAPSLCPTACRQLVPGSDLLADLPQTPAGPRWVSVWTAQDDVVTPPTSARLDGAVNVELQRVCTDEEVRHGQLPTDPLVIGLVRRALAVAPLERVPAPSECASLRGP
jgi:triacylglycerol lipase